MHNVLEGAAAIMEMMHDLCHIAGLGIGSGINIGEKGDKAACYIVERLHQLGLSEARLEPIRVKSPFPQSYEITVRESGREVSLSNACFPLHWTAGTPEEGITGELVYVGDGSRSQFEQIDVAGKIVLINEMFMRGYIATAKTGTIMAKEKGAIAVFRANMIVDSPQQQKGEGSAQDVIPIPVFCFSKSGGDYLREMVLSGVQHTVSIKLDVPHREYNAHNVVFELPGNGRTNECILVGTHYDTGHFTGAVDNNGSVALMIKLAEYFFTKSPELRNRDMIFAWCSGHDYDLNSGHYQFADKHKDQLKRAIVWDVDHALGGTRYRYDDTFGKIVPLEGETCEFYIISNNYVFSRLATFSLEKNGFICTQNRFETIGRGPQWGIAPDTCPWVNAASIPLYYHSLLDTPDKITQDHAARAFLSHTEILENIDNTPEGFLYYSNLNRSGEGKPPEVFISILSKTVNTGDTVYVWNDETRFKNNKTSFHYPALPEWAGTVWDWGDGTPATIGGPTASHIYSSPGIYTIRMSFTNSGGDERTAEQQIIVTRQKRSAI